VDRSELDPVLMKDPMVTFVKGDAFTYQPPSPGEYWMISDVIAYPERTTEMLSQWCENKWASNMIVTMKFQGDEPDLDELNNAIDAVTSLGYQCRVKHFFNNKNEVTFMVSSKDEMDRSRANLEMGDLGSAMYPSL
jgi:23S rRNA C2498 (ribose-2'-O)-methylase RlmM